MILSLGSKGNEVKNLQARLNGLGYKDNSNRMLSEDGSFGPCTEEAVNNFKNAILPGGNKGIDYGKDGETTWNFLNSVVPLPPYIIWLPPYECNEGKPWTPNDINNFETFENGNKLIWTGCNPKLMYAKEMFEDVIKNRGWTAGYTSAYRPLIYQAHFYDIKNGPASKTAIGQAHCAKHGIKSASYPNRASSPHIRGIAFDAVIRDSSGKQLNPDSGVSAELIKVASLCGLRINTPNDNVHFQLLVV